MLHWAANIGNGDLCKYLSECKGDPCAQDKDGRRPRDCAEENGQTHMSCIFDEIEAKFRRGTISQATVSPALQQGMKGKTIRTTTRSTTMMRGGGYDSEDSNHNVESELANAIPPEHLKAIEAIDEDGWKSIDWDDNFTLFNWAAQNTRPDLVAQFIWKRADPDHLDGHGKSAINYAREHNSKDALHSLLNPPTAPPPFLGTVGAHHPQTSMASVPRLKGSLSSWN